jgi:hypothetical protein
MEIIEKMKSHIEEILNDEFSEYGLNENSKPSDFEDFYDFISFIITCEKKYDLQIFDAEASFFESKNLTFKQIHYFFEFILTGNCHESILNLIDSKEIRNEREIYKEFKKKQRDEKINKLLE